MSSLYFSVIFSAYSTLELRIWRHLYFHSCANILVGKVAYPICKTLASKVETTEPKLEAHLAADLIIYMLSLPLDYETEAYVAMIHYKSQAQNTVFLCVKFNESVFLVVI